MVKLLFSVVYEKERRLEVAVEDKTGRKRKVTIAWHTRDMTPIPEGWLDLVEKELDAQDGDTQAALDGRRLFR